MQYSMQTTAKFDRREESSPIRRENALPGLKEEVLARPADAPSSITVGPEAGSPRERPSAASLWESALLVHELRQPLSAIISNAEATLRWLSPNAPNLSAAQESARKIIRDARAAANTMEGLRNLFRGVEPQKTYVDVNTVIFEVLCRLANRIEEKRIATKRSSTADSVYVNANRPQLEEVIHNLISNAIDAMEETPLTDRMLFVHSSRQIDGTIRVSLEDKGRGVEDVERIFDPFFSTKDQGLGLGLWISRCIIQSHKGKLWAEKVGHGGTRLVFTVPSH